MKIWEKMSVLDVRKQIFQLLKKSRSLEKKWEMHGHLILGKKDYLERAKIHCAGCGGTKINPRKWFGEMFCGECVDKFERGER